MSQVLACPSCNQKVKLPDTGGVFDCPGCDHVFRTNANDTPAPQVAEQTAGLYDDPDSSENPEPSDTPVTTSEPTTAERSEATEPEPSLPDPVESNNVRHQPARTLAEPAPIPPNRTPKTEPRPSPNVANASLFVGFAGGVVISALLFGLFMLLMGSSDDQKPAEAKAAAVEPPPVVDEPEEKPEPIVAERADPVLAAPKRQAAPPPVQDPAPPINKDRAEPALAGAAPEGQAKGLVPKPKDKRPADPKRTAKERKAKQTTTID